jgi:CBS domain containing-hemolysin-like protein
LFSVSLRMSPKGGLDHVMVSKSLLTLSFSTSFSSSTTLFVRFSILFPWSIMISTSYSVPNCFNISGSSFGPSFFSITAIFCLTYHTYQFWIFIAAPSGVGTNSLSKVK